MGACFVSGIGFLLVLVSRFESKFLFFMRGESVHELTEKYVTYQDGLSYQTNEYFLTLFNSKKRCPEHDTKLHLIFDL